MAERHRGHRAEINRGEVGLGERKISRHYTCQNRFIVYLVTCKLCDSNPQYVGQSKQTMAQRHRGHRSEINRGEVGLGEHFHILVQTTSGNLFLNSYVIII